MSFHYLSSPAFIALTFLAFIALLYSTSTRLKADNRPLIFGYVTMGIANLLVGLQRIVVDYVK